MAVGSLVAILLPLLLDLALWLLAPLERRLGRRFVDQADARLRSVAPLVVAITGRGRRRRQGVPARSSPLGSTRSQLRRASTTRGCTGGRSTSNSPGVEVFVAEMGTYGPGEIADLVSWVQPRVAVITAIGPSISSGSARSTPPPGRSRRSSPPPMWPSSTSTTPVSPSWQGIRWPRRCSSSTAAPM